MATITAGVVTPVGGAFATSTAASGTFIPTLWSAQLAKKFYTATVFSEIANTDWSGELKAMGDKVVINTIPSLTVNRYVIGQGLTYEVPTPSTIELQIDQGLYFAFQVNDVIEYQSKPNLMSMFSNDAGMQMKMKVDSTSIFNLCLNPNTNSAVNMTVGATAATVNTVSSAGAALTSMSGATAGARSAAYNLGTNLAPVTLTGSNVLNMITAFSGCLDEANAPETDRWLLIDPLTRNLLMQSNLAQAQFMGDSQSMIRNGRIGTIDRFTVYVSNNLPKGAASAAMKSGDATETLGATHTAARRLLVFGHKSAWTFASQITKTEQVRNPYDFGDYIRSLNIFGYKTTKSDMFGYAYVS
jgi:hypothetical protein